MPVARLDDRAVLSVSGADARHFLQNLVTADLDRVDAAGSGYAALLMPQGKILFDFLVYRTADGYDLDVRADAAAALAARLSLYKLRAAVTVDGPRADRAVFAAWGDGEAALAGGRPDPRLAALGARAVVAPDAVSTDAGPAAYHAHRIALGVPEGGLDFAFGDTFPHDAAMDALSGVAFDKGCFVGQEVVSRMRHRGTARRRVVTVAADGDLPPPGTGIAAGDRPIGTLGTVHGPRGIAIVRLDRLAQAFAGGEAVTAGAVEVSLSLPQWATYALPEATDAGGDR